MTWTPPDDPDPSDILNSAASDTRDGLHAQALAKFLWFHHNALRYRRSLSGVRLSFALSFWMELAAIYPPARAAFIRTRDETEAAFRAGPPSFELFHDLAALNEHLGDGGRTADLFLDTARNDDAGAAVVSRRRTVSDRARALRRLRAVPRSPDADVARRLCLRGDEGS